VAKKELDFKKNPNEKNARDVEKMKAEAAYEVAKEKCEGPEGRRRCSICKKAAKAEKDTRLASRQGQDGRQHQVTSAVARR
jgi:hypothetical protein